MVLHHSRQEIEVLVAKDLGDGTVRKLLEPVKKVAHLGAHCSTKLSVASERFRCCLLGGFVGRGVRVRCAASLQPDSEGHGPSTQQSLFGPHSTRWGKIERKA